MLRFGRFLISGLAGRSEDLGVFDGQVHDVVGELLYARNFYIALLSEDGDRLEFPYSIDERDTARVTRTVGAGMTEYVITRGRAVLADRPRISELEAQGHRRSHRSLFALWPAVTPVPHRWGDVGGGAW